MQSVHPLTEGRASTIHMVSAYASSNKLVLGQIKQIKRATTAKTMESEQAHSRIESMHWVLDVSMNEDACQIYKDNGAA